MKTMTRTAMKATKQKSSKKAWRQHKKAQKEANDAKKKEARDAKWKFEHGHRLN